MTYEDTDLFHRNEIPLSHWDGDPDDYEYSQGLYEAD